MLGQVAVQEMTHVSTGPSGPRWEQTLNRADQGSRGSRKEGSFCRFPRGPAGTPGVAGASHGPPEGSSVHAGWGRSLEPRQSATERRVPRPPHVPAPSPAATHTSCGLRHPPRTEAAEPSKLTSCPHHFRESTLPRSPPPNQYIERPEKASSLPPNHTRKS